MYTDYKITTDSAANIVKACKEAVQNDLICNHVKCFAHIINLATKAAVEVTIKQKINYYIHHNNFNITE